MRLIVPDNSAQIREIPAPLWHIAIAMAASGYGSCQEDRVERESGSQVAQWLMRRLQSRTIIALLAVAGLLITATVSGWLYRLEHKAASRAFERSVEARAQDLQRELLAGVEGLYTLREVIRYVDSLPVLVFDDVAASVLARNPDILSLEWIPLV